MSDPDAIAEQHQLNSTRAATEGYAIPNDPAYRFSDDGIIGTSDAKTRPGFGRLLGELPVHEGKRLRLYVRDSSRLSRSPDFRYLMYLEMWLELHGIEVVHLDDPIRINDNATELETVSENAYRAALCAMLDISIEGLRVQALP